MKSTRSVLPSAAYRAEKVVATQLAKGLSLVRSPINPRRVINALLPRGMEDVLAGPEIMDASVPSMNGFFTARSLGALYATLAGGGTLGDVRLLSPETVEKVGEEQNNRPDLVLIVPMKWRLGYHRVMTSRGGAPKGFGHFGLGGSGAWADPSRGLAVALVCNPRRGTPRPITHQRRALHPPSDCGCRPMRHLEARRPGAHGRTAARRYGRFRRHQG